MIDEKYKCPSCGVKFIEHVGVVGTCAKLIETQARLDEAVKLLSEAEQNLTEFSNNNLIENIQIFLAEVGR
jgi:hypothetical protein